MKQARQGLLFVAALVAAAVTARLGWWQLDRAQQKLAIQAGTEARAVLPPLDAGSFARDAKDASGQQHRRVVLGGRWLARHTVYLDNRPLEGRSGFIVVTPLELAPGDAVLVQRGWIPRDPRERTHLVPIDTPDGVVQVQGRAEPLPSALLALGAGPAETGAIRQNLELSAFGREIGMALRPLTVQQLDEHPAPGEALQRRWPAPAVNVGTNYGYAFQWFALSALITGLYVWFQLIRPRFLARRRSAG